jgi:hypothetical protein
MIDSTKIDRVVEGQWHFACSAEILKRTEEATVNQNEPLHQRDSTCRISRAQTASYRLSFGVLNVWSKEMPGALNLSATELHGATLSATAKRWRERVSSRSAEHG